MTPYQKAWAAYAGSTDYATSFYAMQAVGMKEIFINNILRLAFDAAWNYKK